jgi:hypothetical protein
MDGKPSDEKSESQGKINITHDSFFQVLLNCKQIEKTTDLVSTMTPRFKIPSHVAAFGLVTVPGVLYGSSFVLFYRFHHGNLWVNSLGPIFTAMYWMKNHQSDEEMEKILNQKYSSDIKDSREKRDQMVQVLMNSRSQDNVEIQRKVDNVLYGGNKR